MCVIARVCVRARTYQRSSNIRVRPPPFTNTCIILSGRKGPVSYSFLSSDTSQASEGVAEGLMTPLLKARARLPGMTDPANYLIPSLLLSHHWTEPTPSAQSVHQMPPVSPCAPLYFFHPYLHCLESAFISNRCCWSQRSLGERQGMRAIFFHSSYYAGITKLQ